MLPARIVRSRRDDWASNLQLLRSGSKKLPSWSHLRKSTAFSMPSTLTLELQRLMVASKSMMGVMPTMSPRSGTSQLTRLDK